MVVVPPKTVVGNKVKTKASYVTHDACRIFGSLWKSKKISGKVIASDKRIPHGSTRNATFITTEWTLPGRVVVKELNGRLVEYMPPSDEDDAIVAAVAAPVAAPDEIINATADPILPVHTNISHTVSTPPATDPHPIPQSPPTVPPQKDVDTVDGIDIISLPNDVPPPPSMPPLPPSRPTAPVPCGAEEAHGRVWTIDDRAITEDVNGPIPYRQWYIIDSLGERIMQSDSSKVKKMSRLDLFMLQFPPQHLLVIIRLTSRNLIKLGKQEITKGELIKFFGIIILGTRFEFGSRSDLWSLLPVSRFVEAPKFGEKTGMSRNRFDDIWRCMRFSEQPAERPEGLSSMEYRWMLVNDFIDAFNDYRASNYSPSDRICVDESISRWYGLGGHWINAGLPNYVAMERKPENGCEIQDACDGRSRIMIRLKLVKGAIDNEVLAGADEESLHGTRVMKELVAPWAHSGRVVAADSYFASVPCALALHAMGLRFIGVVKTATRQFPMNYLSTVEMPQKGDYKGVVNIGEDGYKLLAFVWVDRERRYFISNCSSLSPGIPYTRTRWRQVEDLDTQLDADRIEFTIPQPKCAEEFYGSAAQIDRHNRSRQANLKIETKYVTKDWDKRVNLSIVSIIIVDSWYFKDGVLGIENDEFENQFYEGLAAECIDNKFDDAYNTRTRMADGSSELDTRDGRVASGVGVHLTPTKKRRCSKGVKTNYIQQDWCSGCRGMDDVLRYKTTYVCSACRDEDGLNVAFCHTKTGRLCFRDHIENDHNDDNNI